jgi:predicted phosphodiesterase
MFVFGFFALSQAPESGAAPPAASSTFLHTILFVSDTQQPLAIEKLRLTYEDNEDATQKIYAAIRNEPTAEALFHLGDITAMGELESYWKPFDQFRSKLSIPVYPVFGNHEYMLLGSIGKKHMLERFPFLTTSWYEKRVGNVAIVLLNSNFSELSYVEKALQEKWYRDELDSLEQDASIASVIVCCHHAPFTNSTIVDPNEDVQLKFVVPFELHKKCKVFMTGHAHTYEHFQKNGKDFLVIGGGGGLLHPLKKGKDAKFVETMGPHMRRRFFHFVECNIYRDHIVFNIKMLQPDFSGFDLEEEISIPD